MNKNVRAMQSESAAECSMEMEIVMLIEAGEKLGLNGVELKASAEVEAKKALADRAQERALECTVIDARCRAS